MTPFTASLEVHEVPTGMPIAVVVQLVELLAALGGRKAGLLAGGRKFLLGLLFRSCSIGAKAAPTAGVLGSLK